MMCWIVRVASCALSRWLSQALAEAAVACLFPGPQLLVTAFCVVAFLSSLGFSIVMPFMVLLVMRFGGNALALGALGALFWSAQLVGSTWLGTLSDRGEGRRQQRRQPG
ncbi:MAG TPA: hypothetical protein VHW23_36870 [Kofleriaceae bacterium]|jgi:MFS family permease|nr:hypothetical protein [Kofleriaceae bacterium]